MSHVQPLAVMIFRELHLDLTISFIYQNLPPLDRSSVMLIVRRAV